MLFPLEGTGHTEAGSHYGLLLSGFPSEIEGMTLTTPPRATVVAHYNKDKGVLDQLWSL